MFKKYLRIQPAPVQLIIFLAFWSILLLLSQLALPFYFRISLGITTDQLEQFIKTDMYNYPGVIFVSNAIFQVGTFLLPALLYAYLADPEPVAYLGIKKPQKPIQLFWVVLLAISLIFFVSPLAAWLKEIDLGSTSKALDEQRDKIIASYLSGGNTWTSIRSIFLIAVIPAICEELFFRGMLMKVAHSFVPKWWFSISVSALVFAAFHTSISEFVPIFIAGIILGMTYYLTSSLWLSILLHLVFNGIQAIGGIYSNSEMNKQLESGSNIAIIFGIAAALVVFCLYFLFKNKTILPQNWSIVLRDAEEEKWDMDA
jgi:membrane protease YdiL (CAAX protease family)